MGYEPVIGLGEILDLVGSVLIAGVIFRAEQKRVAQEAKALARRNLERYFAPAFDERVPCAVKDAFSTGKLDSALKVMEEKPSWFRGEMKVLAVIGSNGQGKTELLNELLVTSREGSSHKGSGEQWRIRAMEDSDGRKAREAFIALKEYLGSTNCCQDIVVFWDNIDRAYESCLGQTPDARFGHLVQQLCEASKGSKRVTTLVCSVTASPSLPRLREGDSEDDVSPNVSGNRAQSDERREEYSNLVKISLCHTKAKDFQTIDLRSDGNWMRHAVNVRCKHRWGTECPPSALAALRRVGVELPENRGVALTVFYFLDQYYSGLVGEAAPMLSLSDVRAIEVLRAADTVSALAQASFAVSVFEVLGIPLRERDLRRDYEKLNKGSLQGYERLFMPTENRILEERDGVCTMLSPALASAVCMNLLGKASADDIAATLRGITDSWVTEAMGDGPEPVRSEAFLKLDSLCTAMASNRHLPVLRVSGAKIVAQLLLRRPDFVGELSEFLRAPVAQQKQEAQQRLAIMADYAGLYLTAFAPNEARQCCETAVSVMQDLNQKGVETSAQLRFDIASVFAQCYLHDSNRHRKNANAAEIQRLLQDLLDETKDASASHDASASLPRRSDVIWRLAYFTKGRDEDESAASFMRSNLELMQQPEDKLHAAAMMEYAVNEGSGQNQVEEVLRLYSEAWSGWRRDQPAGLENSLDALGAVIASKYTQYMIVKYFPATQDRDKENAVLRELVPILEANSGGPRAGMCLMALADYYERVEHDSGRASSSLGQASDWFIENDPKPTRVSQVIRMARQFQVYETSQENMEQAKVYGSLIDRLAATERRVCDTAMS